MNEDELKSITMPLLTDIKYENGKLYAYWGNDKMELENVTNIKDVANISYDLDSKFIKKQGTTPVQQASVNTSISDYTSSAGTYHCDTRDITATNYAVDTTITTDANYTVRTVDADNSCVLNIGGSNIISGYSTYTDYFLDKETNLSWIIGLFSPYYVDQINKALENEKKNSCCIEFFGICNGKTKSMHIVVDILQSGIKDIFKKASSQAKNSGFSELFGPITDKISKMTYVFAAEGTGDFYKEFYDEDKLIELVKSHRLPIKGEFKETKQHDCNDRIKSLEDSIEQLKKYIDDYKKKAKAPYELVDEEDEEQNVENPSPQIVSPWWEVRPQDLPWYGDTTKPIHHYYDNFGDTFRVGDDPKYPAFTISCNNSVSQASATSGSAYSSIHYTI